MPTFDEQTLRDEIVNVWGPVGAHIDVYDELLKRLNQTQAERDQFKLLWDGTRDTAEKFREALEKIALGTLAQNCTGVARAVLYEVDRSGRTNEQTQRQHRSSTQAASHRRTGCSASE